MSAQYLSFKDHKGWTEDKGGVPPTRHVAGGHRGMNLHISEIVSDILEPMVGRVEGGQEVISTEDSLSVVEDVNTDMRGWTNTSWWEGKEYKNFVACGKCQPDDEYEWSEDKPELCSCEIREEMCIVEDKLEGEQNQEIWDSHLQSNSGDKGMEDKQPNIRCTHRYIRTMRRLEWEENMEWDEDPDRILDSTEVLEEDLQDYSVPMVVVGSDVVSLYPNLDVDKIVQRVGEEVERTDMKFSNIDYVEATRYLVLNWTPEQCRTRG